MEIIRKQDTQIQPWKNGLGTTREITSKYCDGSLLWRLSLATVETDGPFSKFPGYTRILTVVAGNGMRLVSTDTGSDTNTRTDLNAAPFCPTRFSGTTAINGFCQNGPVQNFNLIFDAKRIIAELQMISDISQLCELNAPNTLTAVFVLSGNLPIIDGPRLKTGDTCLYTDEPLPFAPISQTNCICVRLIAR
jgi:environmental stress-induced protein Ves